MAGWEEHLSRAARDAHADWIRAHRSGHGRLVLEGKDLRGARMRGGAWLGASRFVGCDLRGAVVVFSFLNDADFIDCNFDGANFSNNNFERARIERSSFVGAELTLFHLKGSRIESSTFDDASMTRAWFEGADVRKTSFTRARMADARFDDASFEACDLREAVMTFDPTGATGGTTRNARFCACDLRGANVDRLKLNGARFERCGLHGATGTPDVDGPYMVVEPDLSPGFDGSGVVAPSKVYSLWGEPLAVPRPPPPVTAPSPKEPPHPRRIAVIDTRKSELTSSFHLQIEGHIVRDGSKFVPESYWDKMVAHCSRNYPEPYYRVVEGAFDDVDALLTSAGITATRRRPEPEPTPQPTVPLGMALVPGGPFRMGISPAQAQAWAESLAEDEEEGEWDDMLHPLREVARDREKYLTYLREAVPDRIVMVEPFFIDIHPVTEEEYAAFVRETSHRAPPHWKKGQPPKKKLALRPATEVASMMRAPTQRGPANASRPRPSGRRPCAAPTGAAIRGARLGVTE